MSLFQPFSLAADKIDQIQRLFLGTETVFDIVSACQCPKRP